MNLYVETIWTEVQNAPDGEVSKRGLGSSGVYETGTENKGELYRDMMREYGRCTSKVYIDTKDGKTKHIGWCFLRRKKYDNCDETFLAETWVTIHEKPPTVTKETHYADLAT